MSEPVPTTSAADLLRIYAAADKDTRKTIDELLRNNQKERTRQFGLDVAGMACGFTLAAGFMGAAVALGLNGAEWAAAVIGGVDIAVVARVFVGRGRT